jgi:hypothetical protein
MDPLSSAQTIRQNFVRYVRASHRWEGSSAGQPRSSHGHRKEISAVAACVDPGRAEPFRNPGVWENDVPDGPRSRAGICVNSCLGGTSSPAVPNLLHLSRSSSGRAETHVARPPQPKSRLWTAARDGWPGGRGPTFDICCPHHANLGEVGRLAAAYGGSCKGTHRAFASAVARQSGMRPPSTLKD